MTKKYRKFDSAFKLDAWYLMWPNHSGHHQRSGTLPLNDEVSDVKTSVSNRVQT
ncbi:hypothetical protein CFBP3846_03114 [Pseudomonas syringae pv. avii]|uniref:Transposase n=1 Tax=Pseudomonas syringae pv. avii TaxID=663959 RepID=A0ABY1U9Q3_PSESX|nr:hypothetical protein CFBP3846_03114 [Pseudomonas syringae pv. avii]